MPLLGLNLPMDTPPPKPHDIVLHGQIVPPAKTCFMQLRRQKVTMEIQWVSWVRKYAGGALAPHGHGSQRDAPPQPVRVSILWPQILFSFLFSFFHGGRGC